jgi:drug/metabolite transporter (DMT)-like permease
MSVAFVLAAALCNGVAVVLQARAARQDNPGAAASGLLLRLLRRPVYLLALGLIAAGFGCAAVALQTLPVFFVQAGRASSLAVTAVLAVALLGARLRAAEIAAIAAVGAGLVLLAGSARPGPGARPGPAVTVAVVVAVALLVAVVVLAGRRSGGGLLIATTAGAGFGLLAFALHTVGSLNPLLLVTQPLAWAAGVAALTALHGGALALQRSAVMAVTAVMVATETLLGSVLGLLLGGDGTLPGRGAWAVAGFTAVLGGALVLSRFGSEAARSEIGL